MIEKLQSLKDESYKNFIQKGLPGVDDIIGVRIPVLRKLAKEIYRNNYRVFLEEKSFDYYEERLLYGFVLGLVEDREEVLIYLESFLDYISSWAEVDSFASSLKIVSKDLDFWWNYISEWVTREEEYIVRFGIVLILNYYLHSPYLDKVISIIHKLNSEHYYVKMAIAWTLASIYVIEEQKVIDVLNDPSLNLFIFNKTKSKIFDSLKVSKEAKDKVRIIKRSI